MEKKNTLIVVSGSSTLGRVTIGYLNINEFEAIERFKKYYYYGDHYSVEFNDVVRVNWPEEYIEVSD